MKRASSQDVGTWICAAISYERYVRVELRQPQSCVLSPTLWPARGPPASPVATCSSARPAQSTSGWRAYGSCSRDLSNGPTSLGSRSYSKCLPPQIANPTSRIARSLYGADPKLAIEEAKRALGGQKEALEWAILVAEVGLEPAGSGRDAGLSSEKEAAATEEREASRIASFVTRLDTVWPLATQKPDGAELRRRAWALGRAVGSVNADLEALDAQLTALLTDAMRTPDISEVLPGELTDEADLNGDETSDDEEGFAPMRLDERALERSRRELGTPEWALHEGLRQIAFFNLARGARDAKMLRGTRDERGGLWELRHRDTRHPVRVFYRFTPDGPIACAFIAKVDDADQRRKIERVLGWN